MRYLVLLLLALTACGPGAHELVDTAPTRCNSDGGPCPDVSSKLSWNIAEPVGKTSQALTSDPRTFYYGAQGVPYTQTSTDINMGSYNSELCVQTLLREGVGWYGTVGVVYPEGDTDWHLLTRADFSHVNVPDSIQNFAACIPWSAFTSVRPLNVSFQWDTTAFGLQGDPNDTYALGDLEIPTLHSWSTIAGAQGQMYSPRADVGYWAKIVTYTPSLLALFSVPMPITPGYGSAAIPPNFTWPNVTIPNPQPSPYPDVVGFALGTPDLNAVGFISVLFDRTPTTSACMLSATVHQCTPDGVTDPKNWFCAPLAYGGNFQNGGGIGVTTNGFNQWIGYALQDPMTGTWPLGQITCIHY